MKLEIEKIYSIGFSDGYSGLHRIIKDLGNGWYKVSALGTIKSINVAHAVSVEERDFMAEWDDDEEEL